MKKNNINYYITKYFAQYLPTIKGLSLNTIVSYRDTFILFLNYIHDVKKININKLDFNDINESIVEDFLQYLENIRGNSINTRNQRLAAIQAFYRYLQTRELTYFELCSSILSIPNKKFPIKILSYFTVEEITILVNQPETVKKYGFRDYALLLFMYETAARAQELSDLRVNQLYLYDYPRVILRGKGNKERIVPFSTDLSVVLKKYIKVFKIQDNDFVFKNKQNNQITPKGIEYILRKYVQLANNKNPEKFRENYSNHSMRHTRAMHLLESGVNLIYIRDILGHVSVTTTEIYAKANSKIKEKQILDHTKLIGAKERYSTEEKENLLKFLKKL